VIAGRRRTGFLNVLKTGFPAAPAALHGRNKLRPRSPFSDGYAGNRLTLAEWREFSAMHLRAYNACRKNRACAFLAFSGGLLPVLPVSRRFASV
jgi:hypothetical protein